MVEPKIDDEEPTQKKAPKPVAAKAPQASVPAPAGPVDPYLAFIDNTQIIVADDLAAYKRGDEGLIIVLTDVRGRSSLNCSLYLSNKILDKMEEARKKPVNLKLP
jgi:hypothetical protein